MPNYILFIKATLLAALVLTAGGARGEDSATMDAVFWVAGMTDIRIQHEGEVLKHALERTRDTFGDYTLTFSTTPLSTERLLRDIGQGNTVNLITTPAWALLDRDALRSHIIPIPLAQGLLGIRRCLIRREDHARFAAIDSKAALKELRFGMGKGWPDAFILERNDLPLVTAEDLEQLYTMLRRNRLDCLPIGVGEIDSFLAAQGRDSDVMVADTPILFYPLPVFLQVSGSNPKLAQRMQQGLEELHEDGTLVQLFRKYYGDTVAELAGKKDQTFRLYNQFLPEDLQQLGLHLLETDK